MQPAWRVITEALMFLRACRAHGSGSRSPAYAADAWQLCFMLAPGYLHNSSHLRRIAGMKHKSFGKMQCPVARSLERVGEWWSILILRDALHGLKRFDEFQKSLDIAPNMLTRRLNALVDA